MDTNVTTTSLTFEDNDSIASAKGTTTARPAKIDFNGGFVAATHYPNGWLPKGTVLAKRTSDGLYIAYNDAGSGGAATAVGVTASAIKVSAAGAATTGKFWAALQWEGVYKVASAPHGSTPNGVGAMDPNAQADLAAKWLFI